MPVLCCKLSDNEKKLTERYDLREHLTVVNTVLLDITFSDDTVFVAINKLSFIQLSLQFHSTRDRIYAPEQDRVESSVVPFDGIQISC